MPTCSASVSGRGFSGRAGREVFGILRIKDGGGGGGRHCTSTAGADLTLGQRPVDTQLHALKEPWTADPTAFQKARPPALPSTALLTALPYPHSTPAQIPPPLPSPQLPELGSRLAFAS